MVNLPVDVNWVPYIAQIVKWLGIIVGSLVIMGVMGFFYYLMTFTIKCEYRDLYGSGKDGSFSFGKKRTNKFKWIKNKQAWKPLWPLMNREEIEPFDSEYIYPGQNVLAFKLNNAWIPARININKTENQIRAEINPVPYYIRNWQSLKHKQNAAEFANHNWWEDNKHLFMTIATVAICCILCGVVIYLTFKFMGDGRSDVRALADAIKNFGNVPNMVGPR